MVTRTFTYIILLFICATSFAQDNTKKGKEDVYKHSSVVKGVRTMIKASNFSKADEIIRGAWKKHKEAAEDASLFNLELSVLNSLALEENRKMYLSNKPDTAKYFSYIYDMYKYGFICDSLESVPDEKGKVKYHYRSSNLEIMNRYRKNLYASGRYFYVKKDYVNSSKYTDIFLMSVESDLFSAGNQKNNFTIDTTATYVLSVLSSYASSNYKQVIKHLDKALAGAGNTASASRADTLDNAQADSAMVTIPLKAQLMEIGVKSYAQTKDSLAMIDLLKQGMREFPSRDFFFVTLLGYYNERKQYDDALSITDSMIIFSPQNRDYWFIKGVELENLDRADDALKAYGECVRIKADDAKSYSAIGYIYLRKAQAAYSDFNLTVNSPNYSKERAEINKLYQSACSAFEHSRKYDAINQDLWYQGLRECYFKLNKGRELKALDKK